MILHMVGGGAGQRGQSSERGLARGYWTKKGYWPEGTERGLARGNCPNLQSSQPESGYRSSQPQSKTYSGGIQNDPYHDLRLRPAEPSSMGPQQLWYHGREQRHTQGQQRHRHLRQR